MFKEVNPNPLKGMLAIKLALLSLFLLLAGCGGGGGGGGTPATLTAITISPASVTLPKGTSVQLKITGTYSDGTNKSLSSSQIIFSSFDSNIATVDSDGTVVGINNGSSTTITADILGVLSDTVTVDVTAPVLVSLDITPTTATLPQGGLTAQFSATGRLSDGTDADYTTLVTWSSDLPGFATINSTTGLATTVANGTATITAVNGDVEGSASLEVTNPVLNSVVTSPSSPTLGLGTTQQLIATAFYSDDSVYDVTELATWSSSTAANVSVDDVAPNKGVITGEIAGQSATISALFNTVTGSTLASVSAAVLSSIEVQPANKKISNGSQLAFTAIGHYNDGTIQDLTNQVAWSLAPAGIATIDPATGLATAVGVGGPTTITAQEGFTGGDIPGTTELTVKNNTLKSINVTSPEAVLAVGTQTTLTAIGNYSDGDTQDLSGQVTWVSTDSTILAVNASGRVTAVGAGAARISALSSSASGSLIGSVAITVNSAALASIDIELPSYPAMAAGTTQSLKVTGSFVGGHTQDLTDQVVWAVDDPTKASISNDLDTAGELTAVAAPSVTVTASYPGVTSATEPITIDARTLTGLTITPTPASIDIGEVLQLTATAEYDGGAFFQIVTDQVTWTSGSAVTVSNLKGTKGQVRGLVQGTTVAIGATFKTETTGITVDVVNDLDEPIALTIEAAPNVILGDSDDQTAFTVRVLPASEGAADPGTGITLSVDSGTGVLSNTTVTTSNWTASGITLTSGTEGLIVVQAVVTANTSIANTVPIDVTNDFADLIGKTATFAGNDDGAGNLEIGAFFGLFATNLSNRDFNVTAFLFTDSNGDTTGTADPAQLSGGILEAGEQMGFVVQTGDVFPLGIFEAAYGFSDAGTSETFSIGAQYDVTTIP